jgi:hypothetical protein
VAGSIPEQIEGMYMPRAILEQAIHGIRRTYIYELIDQGRAAAGDTGMYGLAHNDGSPKPAFTALKNLIEILSDPSPQSKEMFQPQNLQFSLADAPASLHYLVMAKRDGSYYIAFWLEEQNYDVNKHLETPVNPAKLTFVTGSIFKKAQVVTFHQDGALTTTSLAPGARIPLTATSCVTILKLQ